MCAHLLASSGINLEIRRNVTPENTGFQGFNMTTNISLGCKQMSLKHVAISILVSIGHDNVAAIGFHLYKKSDPLCDRYTDTHHK